MNKLNTQIQRNNIKRLLRHSSAIHTNCFRFNVGNTKIHEDKKFNMCWAFKQAGEQFVCEAEFLRGGRADIINLDQGVIFEIINSESEESIDRKNLTYPLPIRKIYVK